MSTTKLPARGRFTLRVVPLLPNFYRAFRATILVLVYLTGIVCFATAQDAGQARALSRHAPQINGSVEGSLQQMLPESATLNGGSVITGNWWVPGTPTVHLNGHPGFGGVLSGTGSTVPAGYQITLNGNAALGKLCTRTDAVPLPAVPIPSNPTGTRSVTINSHGESPGDWSSLRNLTLNGNVGQYAVPPGSYGELVANGGSGFTLGVPGSTQPAVYNLQRLTLNGQTQIQVVGPVIMNLASGFTANGLIGASANASWLVLNVTKADAVLNGGAILYGYLTVPQGSLTINGNSMLCGGVACDRLIVNGGGRLKLWPFNGTSGDNQPPVAIAQSVQLDEDVATPITLAGNDPESAALTYSVVSAPTHGTLTGTPPNLIYTPAANYNREDQFAFTVSDGHTESAPALVSIIVKPINDAPQAQAQSVTLSEDSWLPITLLAEDVDGDALKYIITAQPSHGTLSGTAPNLIYTPTGNYNGPDSFGFKANDGQLDSNVATVNINVTPVEDIPVVSDLSAELVEDQSAQITLAGTDADGDPLTYLVVVPPKNGTLSGSSTLTYSPNPDFSGTDSFKYVAFDGQEYSAAADVILRVIPVNDAPIAESANLNTDEDQPLSLTLSGTDVDGDPLTWSILTQPAHGTLSGQAPHLVYTPAPDYNGADLFTFKVNDGQVDSSPACVEIKIKPVNDAPKVTPLTLQTIQGNPLPIVLNGTDVDGDGLAYTILKPPAQGALTGDAPDLTYTPSANFSGTDFFTYKANDGTLDSTVETVSIEVVRLNQAPRVDAGAALTVSQPYAAALSGVVEDDGLPAGGKLLAQWSKVSGPGEVTFQDPSAPITKANFSVEGTYVLRLTANDSQLISSSDITITCDARANLAPKVSAGSDQDLLATQVANLAGSATDDGYPAGSSLNIVWSKISGPGTVTFADASRPVTQASFSAAGTYVLQLSANDSQYTRSSRVSITVHPVNQAPVVSAGNGQSVLLSSGAFLKGSVSDDGLPEGAGLALQWSKASGPGEVVFGSSSQAATTATFTSAGTYVLRLVASDTELSGSGDVVVIADTATNKAPLVDAGPNQKLLYFNSAMINGKVTDDGLPLGAPLSMAWSTVSGPGEVKFDPVNAASTSVTFSQPGVYVLRLTASDTDLSASSDVTVSVETQNQAPKVDAGADQSVTLPDQASLQGSITDDGLPVGVPVNLVWSQVSGTGTATFENAASAATKVRFSAPGTYILRLTANDSLASGSDEVTVTVQPQPYRVRTYTSTADFTEGELTNAACPVADQIQLPETVKNGNLIWVANSSKGTVVKIDTDTGKILGEYWTSPNGPAPGEPKNPSRTTVDLNGGVWVANRDGHSVTHIVTPESGLWVDRNGNGICDTSTGLNDIKAWDNAGGADTAGGASTAEDECIIHYTLVNSTGTRHVSVDSDNNVWVGGIGGRNFDLIDGETGLIIRSEKSVGFGGYGGLIDKNGVIWSSNPLLRWDTSKPLIGPNGGNWQGYYYDSYGLGIDPAGYVWNTSYSEGLVRKYAPDGTLVGAYSYQSAHGKGCAVDRNGDVWIAICDTVGASSVAHLKNDGTYLGAVTVGVNPSGVAVDPKGKIWVTNRGSKNVSRIDPAAGPVGADGVTPVGQVDYTSLDLGGDLYNYSDMTGSTLSGKSTVGSWIVVYDSGLDGAQWGSISWNALVTNNGKLSARVASSADGQTFSTPVPITSMGDFTVPDGRYLKVTVNFLRATTGQSPVLYDLTVGTKGAPADVRDHAPTISAGDDFSIKIDKKATVTATFNDDGLPLTGARTVAWSQQSGPGVATFTNPNAFKTPVSFSTPGTYVLRVAGSDGEFSDSSTVTVTCLPLNQAPSVYAGHDFVVRSINTTGTLQGWAADDGLPTGSTLKTQWSLVGGPGSVLFGDPSNPQTTATFSAAGTYVLKLTADDGELTASDLVEVRVDSPSSTQAPTGLQAWWPGNWSAGDLVGGHNGIWSGTADYALGKVSGAFRFDGSAKLVNCSGSLDAGRGGALTVEFWINPSGALDNYNALLVGWQTGASNGVTLAQGSIGAVEVNFKDSNGRDHTLSSSKIKNLDPGVWTHVASTYDKTTGMAFLYFNGVQVTGSNLGSFTPQTSYGFAFGTLATSTSSFSGMLDEIAVYNRALTPEEIYDIYATGSAGKAPYSNNAAPVVNAGPDCACTGTTTLAGSVFDDGLPVESSLVVHWSKIDGPGTVTFEDPNSPTTKATFAAPGIYLLKLTADDGYCQSSDLVEVRVNSASPMATPKGIQGWWPGNWNAFDVVGGHNGSWIGGADYASGKVSGAFRFGGSAKQLSISGSLDAGHDGALTLEFWINPVSVPNNFYVPILGWQSGSNNGVLIAQGNIGCVEAHFCDTSGQDHSLSTSNIVNLVPGVWTHVASTYDKASGMAYLYFNGGLVTSSYLGSFTPQTTYGFGFGSLPNGLSGFSGMLDEIAVYNRALSSEEISNIYAAGAIGKAPVGNSAPVVSAGPDLSGTTDTPINLQGSICDDGLPAGSSISAQWTKVAGPGTVTFDNASVAAAKASFSAAGIYVLKLSADDGFCQANDLKEVRINAPGQQSPAGLQAWWPGNWTTTDVIGGHNAVWSGGASYAPGKVAGAFSFDGSSREVLVPGGLDVGRNGALTVEFWVSAPIYYMTGIWAPMLGWHKGGTQGVVVNEGQYGDIYVQLTDTNGNSYYGGGVAYGLPDSTWTHVAFTYDKGTGLANFYLNGVQASSRYLGSIIPLTSSDFSFGALGFGFQHFQGLIDEVAVYNRALTPAEISSLYSAGAAGKNPPTQSNAAPIVKAGTSFNAIQYATATLHGIVGDDGLPTGAPVSAQWTMVSGPGQASFGDPASPITSVRFDQPGGYVLRLTGNDTNLSSSDDVTVTVSAASASTGPVAPYNNAPVVKAGSDLVVPISTGATLGGDVSDDGLPFGQAITLQWSKTSGPGEVVFTSPDRAATWAQFSVPGRYTLTLSASDSEKSSSSNLTVTVLASDNAAPVVNAGADQSVSVSDPATLSGSVSDDGLPLGGSLTASWHKVSGPGTVTFANPASATTNAWFTTPGTYLLELDASDSEKRASSQVMITVNEKRQNTPPVIALGNDQSIPYGQYATISPSITDDNLPDGVLSVKWTQVAGPAIVQVQSGQGDDLLVTGPKVGDYTLRLTVSDGEFTVSDDVTVTVTPGTLVSPTVQLTSPTPNCTNLQGTLLNLTASASSPNGPIASVEFYADGVKIGERDSGPYAVNWLAPSAGSHSFNAVATDSLALSATSTSVQIVTVVPPLTVTLSSPGSTQRYLAGHNVPLSATTTGLGIANVTFYADGNEVGSTTSAPYVASWVTSVTGVHTLTATVTDSTGATVCSAPVSIEIIADFQTPPELAITAPEDGATITCPTEIKGTASSPILKSWSLSYRERAAKTPEWTQFAAGTSGVSNGTLGTLDPTLLRNGMYDIELVVTDLGGTSYAMDSSIVVDGGMKVGAFTVAFNDLQLPMAGIPITVTRTYDSRMASTGSAPGDFGVGWNLDVSSVHLEKKHALGDGWYADVQPPPTGNPFEVPVYSIYDSDPNVITISFPDGKTCRFHPELQVAGSGAPLQRAFAPYTSGNALQMAFKPLPGTQGQLIAHGIPGALYMEEDSYLSPIRLSSISSDAMGEGEFADGDGFDYISQEGKTFSFDGNGVLTGMRDRNGNALSFQRNGTGSISAIVHTTTLANGQAGASQSLSFVRDGQDRITQIVDPNGHALHYQYSVENDLVAFFDRATDAALGVATASYTYSTLSSPSQSSQNSQSSHYLSGIADARGVQAVRNEYDGQGRLIKSTDAEGKTILYSHDVSGRTETITDRNGNSTVHVYDERGNVLSSRDALGKVTRATYDERNNKLTETNALNQTTTFVYDGFDRLSRVTDPLGHSTAFTYNGFSQPLTITDPLGRVTTNSYDGAGNLVSTTDPQGNTTSYSYDAQGNRTSTTDAMGNTSRSVYDSQGHLVSTTDALGHSITFTYDANGNQVTQTTSISLSAAGGTGSSGTLAAAGGTVVNLGQAADTAASTPLTTTRVYDAQDRLIQTIDPDGSSTQTVYNELGKPDVTFDKLGHQTQMEYDLRGNLVKTTYPDGLSESTSYDAEGRRSSSTDRAGRITSYDYDAVGRLVKTTYADGTFTSSVFDAAGGVESSRDARGNVTSYGYDAAGRRVSVTDALNQTSTSSYDANGNLVAVTDANGNTTSYVYDELNRRVATRFADNTRTSSRFDALGRRVAETDQNGNTTEFGYDGLGRLVSVTQGGGNGTSGNTGTNGSSGSLGGAEGGGLVTRYTYDELGHQLTQTDANHHTTSFAYDSLGRRISRTLPMGMSESLSYDAAGNVVSRTDFNGTVTHYGYDAMNRLVARTVASTAPGVQPASVTFTYTASGQRETMNDSTGTTKYAYDRRDRLIKKTTEEGKLTYAYDANGNVVSMVSSNANGASVSYSYDALNRLESVTDAHLGVTTYGYDHVGNLGHFTTPNGVTHSYQYDALNRLTGVEAAVSAALTNPYAASAATNTTNGTTGNFGSPGTSGIAGWTRIGSYAYTLAPGGQRVAVTENQTRTATYNYDSLYRLTGETIVGDPCGKNGTIAYTYDAVGNRLTRTSSVAGITSQSLAYDANDRLTADQSDANGNTVSSSILQPSSLTGPDTYDSENHLVSRAGTVNIFYDGDGTKVRETVNGQTTSYIVDDRNPTGYPQVVEELTNGSVSRVYTYGHDLLSEDRLDGNGSTWHAAFHGYDGHGSVRFLTDESGQVLERYDYDAFGLLLNAYTGNSPQSAVTSPLTRYLYCGEQLDPTLGLYYLRARYMNAASGRFWTMDSFEGKQEDPNSMHKYLYTSGNPIGFCDPSGHETLLQTNFSAATWAVIAAAGTLALLESRTHALTNLTSYLVRDLLSHTISSATTQELEKPLTQALTYDEANERVKEEKRGHPGITFVHGTCTGRWMELANAEPSALAIAPFDGEGTLGCGFYTTSGDDPDGVIGAAMFALAKRWEWGGIPVLAVFRMDENVWKSLSKYEEVESNMVGPGINSYRTYKVDVVMGPLIGSIQGYGSLPRTRQFKFEGRGIFELALSFKTIIPLYK